LKAWLHRFRLVLRNGDSLRCGSAQLSSLDRTESLPEAAFNEVSIEGGQRVLCREVLVDPVGGLVRGFEIAKLGEQ
jgi:hypothetical protein